MPYPTPLRICAAEPPTLAGKCWAGFQILNTSFGELDLPRLRREIAKLKKAKIRVIRDNELDYRCDFQANIAAAQARSIAIRAHIGVLAEELANAGIFYMPTLGHWAFGLDIDNNVIAAMPGGFPMTGATSLYNSLGNGAGAWSGSQNNKHTVRYFLMQLAIFGDGGTYAGPAGAKPGPNRTTALGGDPLIDAIWDWFEADIASWSTALAAVLEVWWQFLNGGENGCELTRDLFWPGGYFGNSTSDPKQIAANTIARNCGVHFPHTTANPNPDASATIRDDTCDDRMEWAVRRVLFALYGNDDAENLLMYFTQHRYDRKWRERFVGPPTDIIDEYGMHRPYAEPRTGADPDRVSASLLHTDYDNDKVWYIRARAGVPMVLSIDGGLTTISPAANCTEAQLRTALRTIMGDDIEHEDDITVWRHQSPSDDGTIRDAITEYEVAGGYETYGYMVRYGGTSGVNDSKSKRKPAPFEITSHNATPNDCVIRTWLQGGEVDRGPGVKAQIQYFVRELGIRGVIIHSPIASQTADEDVWNYGDPADPDNYENWRVTNGKERLLNVAGPMMWDEQEYHNIIWNGWFGGFMEQQNE